MKERTYLLNILLALAAAAACCAVVIARAVTPAVVLPKLGLPELVLLTVIPLAVEHYLGAPAKRDWIGSTVLAALTFTALPLCAGLTKGLPVWQLFLYGAAVYLVTTGLYTSMAHRMRSGPTAKAAPAINALLLYLAAQFFQGIL